MTLHQRKTRWTKMNLFLLAPFLIGLILLAIHVVAAFAQEPPPAEPTLGFSLAPIRLVGAGLAVGLAGIGAGIAIHGSTSAGLAAIVEKPELTTWVLVFAGLGEGIAIYGLVVAIMILGMA